MTFEEIKQFFTADRFATELAGIEIREAEPGRSLCTMQITPGHMNAGGSVMGGAIYTLCDFAFAVAANQDPDMRTVTTASQINFLSAGRGGVLTAEAHVLKDGRKTCFYEINVKDESGVLIAFMTATGVHLQLG